ncbi:hypothetical protein HDF26_001634 [Pedobacter cryoconitis]|uniref:hypothetical protein n=1 Tax=Pedobacter cryoconitis TaxID=188932 RepID=UPI00160A547D|nr:hypothetical protein [Pedobacter cryoconitis]MBB6271207.1 hypothetical protein [Pedobacter cryoconitis]
MNNHSVTSLVFGFKTIKYRVILIIAFCIAIIGGCSSNNSNKIDDSTSFKDKTDKPTILTLKDKINQSIKSIDEDTDLEKISLSEVKDFTIAITVYKIYVILVKEGEASTDKEILKLTKKLRSKLVAKQIENFPKLRKAYYQVVKNRLWEEDILVNVDGSRFTVLKFTGGYFAANKNIKETEQTLDKILTNLRFKQTQYRWYKGQDEYTFYTIDSSKDGSLE